MDTLKTYNILPITSVNITLEKVVANRNLYNIPIYQRLYVWGNDQIKILLEDLYKAFEEEQPKYYLGGVMVTQNNGKLDLIDGQQRFTTLWLIGKILGYDLRAFTHIEIDKVKKSRMSFSVRDFANHYFNATDVSFTKEEKEELQPILVGEKVIEKFVKELDEDIRNKFSEFIYKKVFLISTEMPQETDENKVFEAMNNRGVQLQQHEILKSRLLSVLKTNRTEMHQYSLLWDACSLMDDYIEKNIKVVGGLFWKSLFPEVSEEDEIVVQLPKNIHSRLNNNFMQQESKNLLSILNDKTDEEITVNKNADTTDYDSGKVRSIINFPMLLLHALRIFQLKYKNVLDPNESAEVKGKDLIEIFKKHNHYFTNPQDVKNFIDLLWNIRQNFDRHVIKWVGTEENNEEVHLIKKLYQSKTAFQRKAPVSNEGFALLQSMLYHSQQIITHYWLTPFLNKMLEIDNTEDLYIYLEKLDNAMFCTEKRDLRTMSYEMMIKNDGELMGDTMFVEKTINSSLGTAYPSYWFYKIDYVLWKNRDALNRDNWTDYRMTAKNSVEHISPQNPKMEDTNVVYSLTDSEDGVLRKKNDFGNLVLLSVGMNSEYSNKTYNVKKIEYREKRRLDSLKSDLIFHNENWNWDSCEKHRRVMEKLLLKHIQ